jgi:hypothetical protein
VRKGKNKSTQNWVGTPSASTTANSTTELKWRERASARTKVGGWLGTQEKEEMGGEWGKKKKTNFED